MELEPKYTKGSKYLLEDEFIASLEELDVRTAVKIARYIDSVNIEIPFNDFTSTILGGVINMGANKVVTFAVEVINTRNSKAVLSDFKLITMDEYLDLYNLNLILEKQ
jgi:hypothetical protein|tara:strand:+ start:798 stop:1121 length:324 start_codon:yes stop_codon:yes gene_type:complete